MRNDSLWTLRSTSQLCAAVPALDFRALGGGSMEVVHRGAVVGTIGRAASGLALLAHRWWGDESCTELVAETLGEAVAWCLREEVAP